MFADGEKYREGDGSGPGAGRSGDCHGHFKGNFSREIFFSVLPVVRLLVLAILVADPVQLGSD